MRITRTSVLVDDQAKALDFYTRVLGFVKKHDIPLGEYRWLTVVSPDDPTASSSCSSPTSTRPRTAVQGGPRRRRHPVRAVHGRRRRGRARAAHRGRCRFTQPPAPSGPVVTAVLDDTCGNLVQIVASPGPGVTPLTPSPYGTKRPLSRWREGPGRPGRPTHPRRPRATRAQEVVFVDGVRTPFGKAGEKGMYAQTRADDLVIKCIRELMRRHPELPKERVEEVALAATTQIGDQGLTLGRLATCSPGCRTTTPGYSVDRMCAGAMTAVTNVASSIGFGAIDVAIAGGVEHMGRHPMGEGIDPNPRIVAERIVDESALVMGKTAENLHDRFPHLTRERCDAYAVNSQRKLRAPTPRQVQPDLVPVATRHVEKGWGLATVDEPPAGHHARGARRAEDPVPPARQRHRGQRRRPQRRGDRVPPRVRGGRGRAGPAGAMRLVSYAFVGVEPEVMGIGPVPAAEKALRRPVCRSTTSACSSSTRRSPCRSSPSSTTSGSPTTTSGSTRGVAPSRRPPARLVRRASHDPAGPPLRGAPRGPLRPHRDVHRHRHGRLRHLGEPPPRRRHRATEGH